MSLTPALVLSLVLPALGPTFGPTVADVKGADARFDDVLDGKDAPALSGDDVYVLERALAGADSLAVVRAVGDAVDAAANDGCRVSVDDAAAHAAVVRRVAAIAVVEAARGRDGAGMALDVAAGFVAALGRCLPFDVASSQALENAATVAATAQYLRQHGALDDATAKKLSTTLASAAPAQAQKLARPTVNAGPLVLVPPSVKCRHKDGKTVLSASEAREIGRRYQQRPPAVTPVLGSSGIEGMTVVVDAFLSSCGLVNGDVVQSINGVRAENVDRLLGIGAAIGRDRKAVVVVIRAGAPVTLVVDEDTTTP